MGPLLDFGVVGQAVLLVVGVIWLKEMLPRWRDDLQTLRTSKDGVDRAVVATLWVATVVISVVVLGYVIAIVTAVATAL